mgnify:CR=1 FL=1
MKKLILLISFSVLTFTQSFAQDEDTLKTDINDEYNKWSFEFNLGQSKGIKPYSTGYFGSDPNKTSFGFVSFLQHFDR